MSENYLNYDIIAVVVKYIVFDLPGNWLPEIEHESIPGKLLLELIGGNFFNIH